MAETAEESSKENFLSGRSDGGMFQRQIEEPPQHGKRLKRKIIAAAGSGRAGCREISEKYREPPLNIRNIGLSCLERCLLLLASCSAWPGGIFEGKCSHKENTRSGGVGWRKSSEAGGGSHQADFKTRCKLSSN